MSDSFVVPEFGIEKVLFAQGRAQLYNAGLTSGKLRFPLQFVSGRGRFAFKKHKMAPTATTQEKRKLKKVVVMPYIHRVSPN